MDQIRPLLLYFRPFPSTMTIIGGTQFDYIQKRRRSAWDLNPGLQDGRRRQIHGDKSF